jgi:hypothetical protein
MFTLKQTPMIVVLIGLILLTGYAYQGFSEPVVLGASIPSETAKRCSLRAITSANEIQVQCDGEAKSLMLYCVGETLPGAERHLQAIITKDVLVEEKEPGAGVVWAIDQPRHEDLNLAMINSGDALLTSSCMDRTYLAAYQSATRVKL